MVFEMSLGILFALFTLRYSTNIHYDLLIMAFFPSNFLSDISEVILCNPLTLDHRLFQCMGQVLLQCIPCPAQNVIGICSQI